MTLFEARNKKNLSQMELALKAGITQATLSSIERGRAIPHSSTRLKLEQALGIKVDWIATRLEGPLTRGGFLERTDAVECVINSIAIYVQSGQMRERSERFSFLRKFINKYEKKLKAEVEQQTIRKVKIKRNNNDLKKVY